MTELIVVFILGFGAGVFTLAMGSILFVDSKRDEEEDDGEL